MAAARAAARTDRRAARRPLHGPARGAADGDASIEQAEAFRAHVGRWFYDCPPALLRGLGDMYVADPRFTATYDGSGGERAGFAAWVREAWHARADRG